MSRTATRRPRGSGSTTVAVSLPTATKDALEELHWRRRTSVSALVTEAVEDLLRKAREAGELEAASV